MQDLFLKRNYEDGNTTFSGGKKHAMITALGKFGCEFAHLPSFEELGKLNYIDISKINTYEDVPGGEDSLAEFTEREQHFAILPPFEECLVKASSDNMDGSIVEDYYHVKVLDVDRETGISTLEVQIYWRAVLPPYPAAWMPVQKYTFSYDVEHQEISRYLDGCSMWVFDYLGKREDYLNDKSIPVTQDIRFPPECKAPIESLFRRCNVSKDTIIDFYGWLIDIVSVDFKERVSADITNIAKVFSLVNYLLSKHHCVQAKDYDTIKLANPFNLRVDRKDERVVRKLGTSVLLKSVKAPSANTKERGVTYKLSSWSRRGHVRHYKTGKVIWIREQEVHRKAFQGNESGTVSKRDYIAEPLPGRGNI